MKYTINIIDLEDRSVKIANLDYNLAMSLVTIFANNINLTIRRVCLIIENDT